VKDLEHTRYDQIGRGYALTRRADPRLERLIHDALGDARSVVNVGSGAGSYEPRDRYVIARERCRFATSRWTPRWRC
jgi:hypothetical protein